MNTSDDSASKNKRARLYRERHFSFPVAPVLSESKDLLRKFKGRKIVDVLKLSRHEPSYYKDYSDIGDGDQLFSNAQGPFFFVLDGGLCIGLCPAPINDSLMTWEEKLPLALEKASEKCPHYSGIGFISCQDNKYSNVYCSSFLGARISRLAILTVDEPGTRDVCHDRGLLFYTDDGRDFMLSYDLQEGSGYSLMTRDNIKEKLRQYVTSVEI